MSKLTKKVHILFNMLVLKRRFRNCGCDLRISASPQIRHPEFISIGDRFRGGASLKLEAWPEYNKKNTGNNPELTIGNNVSFMDNCQISCMDSVTIGNNVLFGDNVFVTDNLHGGGISKNELDIPPVERPLVSKGPVVIGDSVWIGRNVCVMPGVSIGNNSIIGANSVVTHDVQSYSIAAGIPAKVIREVR